ncbi:hypothetical protein C8R41DRAFT_913171 [Lentinula lateritia]|uniref:Uncharacterized protein n=1 Tax=Lentinula lateritia TaxID=40482 RepID=A0ABQ8VZT0_9AGAR|nr:hypothetical protein C8R41DRAFT_913171 [Lentinula lateritia]
MWSTPVRSPSRTPSPLLPPLTALGEVPSPDPASDGEVEEDQLAFTLESPSRPQLQLFETVFNTGKPLSGYCQDDPLWLLQSLGPSCFILLASGCVSFNPSAPSYLPGPPPHLPVLPAPMKPSAAAMAGVSSDGVCANDVRAR